MPKAVDCLRHGHGGKMGFSIPTVANMIQARRHNLHTETRWTNREMYVQNRENDSCSSPKRRPSLKPTHQCRRCTVRARTALEIPGRTRPHDRRRDGGNGLVDGELQLLGVPRPMVIDEACDTQSAFDH